MRSASPPCRFSCSCHALFGLMSWLVFLLGSPAAQAQTLVLRGLVLDAETHQPIPNAQVGVASNRIGTSTNDDGYFVLNIPASYANERLTVSLMGYKSYSQTLPLLPGPELVVALKISPAVLGEVRVSGSVLGIVREAVARIPRNYPTQPTRLTGFFRESDNELANGQYRYLGEAVLTVLKAPYTRPKDDGEIVIEQSRKVDLQSKTALMKYGWYAGPFIPHRFDFVHNRLDFINEASFKDYEYKLANQTTYNERPVYVVEFGPKANSTRANFQGRMYIDQQSYAFLAAEWHRTPAGIKREFINFDAEERAYRVDYQLYAGRWHLKSVWYNTRGKAPMGGARIRHLSEFLTTAIDTAQAPAPSYTARAQFRDVFLENAVRYDSTFWKNYTTLLPPEQLRLALRDQDRQQQAEQLFATKPATPAAPTQRLLKILLNRLRGGYAGGLLPLQASVADISVGFAPAGSAFRALAQARAPAQGLAGWYGYYWQFDLAKHLAVYYVVRQTFWNYTGAGWEVGATFERNLRPGHRPIMGRIGVGYTRQRVRYNLGSSDNPDRGLRLDDTKLSADRLSVGLQQLTEAWQPKVGLGVELSHRLEAVADLGLLLPLRTTTEVHLEERSGFFLSRSDVDLPASSATVLVNDQATEAPWHLGRPLLTLTLLYRLR